MSICFFGYLLTAFSEEAHPFTICKAWVSLGKGTGKSETTRGRPSFRTDACFQYLPVKHLIHPLEMCKKLVWWKSLLELHYYNLLSRLYVVAMSRATSHDPGELSRATTFGCWFANTRSRELIGCSASKLAAVTRKHGWSVA